MQAVAHLINSSLMRVIMAGPRTGPVPDLGVAALSLSEGHPKSFKGDNKSNCSLNLISNGPRVSIY